MCKDPVSHSGGQLCQRCGYCPSCGRSNTAPPNPNPMYLWTYPVYPGSGDPTAWGINTTGSATTSVASD